MIEMRIHLPYEPSPEEVATALEPIVAQNAQWFLDNPGAPCCLGCAGVRYYDPGLHLKCQNFWSAPQVLKRKKGTCADAATYAAGKARAKGKQAYVAIEYADQGGYHAVAYIDGQRTDPTTELDGYQDTPSSCACNQDGGFAVGAAPLYVALNREHARRKGPLPRQTFSVGFSPSSLMHALGHGMAAFGVSGHGRYRLSSRTKARIKRLARKRI